MNTTIAQESTRFQGELLLEPSSREQPSVSLQDAIPDQVEMLDAMVGGESSRIPSQRLSLLGCKWRYRGEGNANLVIALPQQREIMRLRKAERRPKQADTSGSSEHRRESDKVAAEHAECERVLREVVFYHRVMVPLIGSCYLRPPVIARLDSTEVQRMNFLLQSQRPVHRHHKEVLCAGGHVTLYPDYALLPTHLSASDTTVPTFCVEIKPKQGWIPQHNRLLPKCTFCTKQFLKLKNKSINVRSSYCPLDLFSGETRRMKNALRALLSTPQNNLKIFKNGLQVYGDGIGDYALFEVLLSWFGSPHKSIDKHELLNNFCSIVIQALTRDLSNGTLTRDLSNGTLRPLTHATTNSRSYCTEFIQSSTFGSKDMQKLLAAAAPLLQPPCLRRLQELPTNCVLSRILNLQMFEQFHIEYELQTSPRSRKDYSYVGAIINDSGALQTPLHRYLLAATAKDCSILLAFQPVSPERAQSLPRQHIAKLAESGQLYAFNVGVSDLDPKPISCIEKHRQRDRDMLQACAELAALQREALNQKNTSDDIGYSRNITTKKNVKLFCTDYLLVSNFGVPYLRKYLRINAMATGKGTPIRDVQKI